MKRTLKKHLACFSVASALICSFNVVNIKANDNINDEIYSDSNVSISSALDRYIASNSVLALDNILGSSCEVEEIGKAAAAECDTYIDFSNKAIVTTDGQVNIREKSDVNSNKVGVINNGGLVNVVEKGSEWSHVKSGKCEGYIKNEFLSFGNDAKIYAENNLPKVAVVNATTLRLRAKSSEESECLTLLTGGEEYGILSQDNGWTKVEVDDSLTGYVKDEYISISYRMGSAIAVNADSNDNSSTTQQAEGTTEKQTAETTTQTTTQATTQITTQAPTTEAVNYEAPSVNANASSVVNYALQFVGNPYVYGGSSLTNGTDCSGFTMSVYSNFGVYLPHSSAAQANCGTEVSLSEAQAGDLIFYKNGGSSIGHVALCIGGGQVVHASTESTGIIVSNMYYSTPCKAVRVY